MDQTNICSVVRKAETNYLSGTVKLGDHVEFSLHDTVERIFAYLNSSFVDGPTDSLGRPKPFFNIVTASVNIWYRATDLDRKDMVVLPNNSSNFIPAFLATLLLQDWMKRTGFGLFLNKWGRTLAQYGSAIVKFIEKNGQLFATVVPWNRAIVDTVDFDSIPRIEKFYRTAGQLVNMATPGHPDYANYNLDKVKELIESQRQSRETLNEEQQDEQDDFLELYEVHGMLSQAVYKRSKGEEILEGDENIFFQQMHTLSFTKIDVDEYDDFILYCGKEAKDPYLLTHLIEEEGRTMSIGAVENLFDAQWMVNHTMKAWKDQMDLASKLIFQTADARFVGKNVLTNIEVGQILYHDLNKPVEQFPNVGHDVDNLSAFMTQWRALSQEVTSTPDAARGNTLPSGTSYSLGAYLGTQALSLFELMTENKGHYLEIMLREWIVPHLKSKMDTSDEVAVLLEDHEIKKIDSMYVPRAAIKSFNDRVKAEILDGGMPTPFDQATEEAQVRNSLAPLGNTRFLSPGDISWKEALKDLEWELDVGITNEQGDKQAILGTLTTVFQTLATNPQVLQLQEGRTLFNKILSKTAVVSPVELSSTSAPSATAVAA